MGARYLPDTRGVEVGSDAQQNLRYALELLEALAEQNVEPEYGAGGNDAGEWEACNAAIATLRFLIRP